MSRRAKSDNLDEQRRAQRMMRRAIGLAAQTQPHPNPRVGAVVASGADVLGEGAHVGAGQDHAEVIALAAAGAAAAGATMYVTLEPCAHHGLTPPCVDAVIAAGIVKVFIGAVDPDERVRGAGVKRLQDAGVVVETGVLADEVRRTDPGYFHHRRTGLPLVTLKLATTLDGYIAAADRTSQWITGQAARADGHRMRAESDVVMIGAGTLHDDNPRLDVRSDGFAGRQPRPVVIAGQRPLPATAHLYDREPLIYTCGEQQVPGEHVLLPAGDQVDLAAVLKDLGARGIVTVLAEGGAGLATGLVRGGHVDRIVLYLAAKLGVGRGLAAFAGSFATLSDAMPVTIDSVTRIGDDLKLELEVGS